MNQRKKNKYNFIFLLDEHNSIDQIAPLIYVLHKNNYRITALKCNINYNYDQDNNINYLKKYCKDVEFIELLIGFSLIDRFKLLINKYISYYCNNKKTNWLPRKLNSLRNIFLNHLRNKFITEKFVIDDYIDQNYHSPIIICELSYGDIIYQHIVAVLFEQKFNIYSFNHGFDVLTNDLLGFDDLSFKKIHENTRIGHSNATIFFSKNSIERYNNTDGDLMVLPSLRFSSHWINNIINRKYSYKLLHQQNDFRLKILLCMSAMCNNVWAEEQHRLIKIVGNLKGVLLYIKVHPREANLAKKLNNEFSNFENVIIVDNKISSSYLIYHSDIVLIVSSGIFVEALIQGKVLFYLKYLHCNSIVLDVDNNFNDEDHVHIVNTRDELLNLINKYSTETVNSVKTTKRSKFLEDYILNDDFEENTKYYLNLFHNNK